MLNKADNVRVNKFKIDERLMFAARIFAIVSVACLIYLAYRIRLVRGGCYDDFQAFYTVAMIVRDGACRSLYNLSEQFRVQDVFFQINYFDTRIFPYPATFAVLLSPLSMFSPCVAYWIFLSVMLMFLWGGICMLQHVKGYSSKLRITIFAYVFSFFPVFSGWVIGQISFYVFFCFAVFIASGLCLLYEEQPYERELLAKVGLGLALGGLLLKPQFAVIPAAYCLLSRQWLSLFVFACIGCLFYAIGAWPCGVFWPIDWLSFVTEYNVGDHVRFWRGSVSVLVAIEHYISFAGFQAPSLFIPCASLACSLFVFVFWAKTWSSSHIQLKEWRLFSIPVLAVLLSPHSMRADSIMFLFPVFYYLDHCKTSRLIIVLIVCQLMGIFELWNYDEHLPVNLVMLMGCAMLFDLSCRHRNVRGSLIP